MYNRLPDDKQLWGIRDHIIPISTRKATIMALYGIQNESFFTIGFHRENTFCVGNRIYSVIKMPADGRCGYHCMSYYRPLSEKSYSDLFGPSNGGWASDKSWQQFANHWKLSVKIFEFVSAKLAQENLKSVDVLKNIDLEHVGTCMISNIDPTPAQDSNGECYILHKESHFDVLEPVLTLTYNIL